MTNRKYTFMLIILLANIRCENTAQNSQQNSPIKSKEKYIPIPESKSPSLTAFKEISDYITVVSVANYTDEDLTKKSKFVIKNISNKTITTVRVSHYNFPDQGETVKVVIKPGQTKTIISNIDIGGLRTASNPEIITAYGIHCVRFSDGSTIGC